MRISQTGECVDSVRVLGSDLGAGQRPQLAVPKDAWQTARYVSCIVPFLFFFESFPFLLLAAALPCPASKASERA